MSMQFFAVSAILGLIKVIWVTCAPPQLPQQPALAPVPRPARLCGARVPGRGGERGSSAVHEAAALVVVARAAYLYRYRYCMHA